LLSLLDWRRNGAAVEARALQRGRGPWRTRWLLVGLGWLAVVAAAFVLGYLLAAHDTQRASARIQALQTERDMLSEQLAAQRDDRIKLERSHQMDVEARRVAQAQIVELERERMRLEQQLTQLRALVGADGRGVAEVDSLVLAPQPDGGYRYRLTVGQLVPDFGRTRGEVLLSVVFAAAQADPGAPSGDTERKTVEAARHALDFEHFQVLTGELRLPEDATPLELIVEIMPKDDTLMSSQEIVHWEAAHTDEPVAATPPQRVDRTPSAQEPGGNTPQATPP
jgi:hypothetical protein